MTIFDVSEADEAATSKHVALAHLRAQCAQGETPAVVDMYERAAWGAGCTVAETEAAIREATSTPKSNLPDVAGRVWHDGRKRTLKKRTT